MLFTSLSQEHMEELLPIWKFCVEPSFPHLVEALRFLGASSAACSVWVITPRLAINSCFSFCSGAWEREWQRIHNLLWHCNISTNVWKKGNLAFQLQLCVAEESNERQQLKVCKYSLKATLLQNPLALQSPGWSWALHIKDKREEMLQFCKVKILPKYINIGREVKAAIYIQGSSSQFYGLSLNNGGQEIHRKHDFVTESSALLSHYLF